MHEYLCQSTVDFSRAMTLFSKEPGTLRWLNSTIREGDVVYDVGANTGIYTIPAAQRAGGTGSVYAFEPHVANCQSLLENVRRNGLDGRIKVLSCALHNTTGFFDFNYSNWATGSSMSQLGREVDPYGAPLSRQGTELKFSTTIDRLLGDGTIRPANAVKIDVDGNELLILEGMRELLKGRTPPRSVQIEVNPDSHDDVPGYMRSCGFEMAEHHYSALGEQALKEGMSRERVPYNGVFCPTGRPGEASH